jgi:type II secretory pathway pseudopilin PulG
MPERSQFDLLALRERGRRCAVQCRRGRCAGFTYIGLLILVAVMSLSMTVVAEVWQSTQQRDKEEELLFVGNQIRRAIGMYAANAASYPHSLEDLLKDPGFPGVRRYLRKIYRDPMTGRAEWGLVKADGNSITGVYSLSDAEPFKQSGFSLADQDFEGKKKYSEWVFFPNAAQGSPAAIAPAAALESGAFTAPPAAPGSAGATTPADSGRTPLDSGQLGPGRPGARVRR